MLEPDVTKRANMNQVSQCLWLKQGVTDFRHRSSFDENASSSPYPISNASTSAQKKVKCAYGKLHGSGECNCKTSSDDSE